MSRREFVKVAGLGGLSLGVGLGSFGCNAKVGSAAGTAAVPSAGQKANQPYNILFILTDQEGYFDGYPSRMRLPGHERLMRNGVTFTNHQIASCVCTPSRSVIYTGQHIQHTGCFDNSSLAYSNDLPTDFPNTGNMLRELGYYTAYKGKWHLTKAFESADSTEIPDRIYNKEMEEYGFSDYMGIGDVIGHTLGGYYHDEIIGSLAVRWLRLRGQPMQKQGKPWFVAMNLINPHDIMYYNTDAPGKNVQQTGDLTMHINRDPDTPLYAKKWDWPLSPSRKQPLGQKGRPPAHWEFEEVMGVVLGRVPNEDDRWRRFQDYYFNCIRDCDRAIERVLKELDELGLADSTIVMLTSDHGELCGAHGMRGKGATVYREQNNVPLIISHPAYRNGKKCKAVTSHLDLVPTIIGMAHADAAKKAQLTKKLHGKDLTPLLAAPDKADLNTVRPGALYCFSMLMGIDSEFTKKAVAAMLGKGEAPKGLKPNLMKRGHIRAVYDGRYKFARYFAPVEHNRPVTMEQLLKLNDLELYDIENDPHEMHNLAADPKAAGELILAMNEKLNALIDGEVGEDVGQMLPKAPGVNWAITEFDP
jgi:arylsulfatase